GASGLRWVPLPIALLIPGAPTVQAEETLPRRSAPWQNRGMRSIPVFLLALVAFTFPGCDSREGNPVKDSVNGVKAEAQVIRKGLAERLEALDRKAAELESRLTREKDSTQAKMLEQVRKLKREKDELDEQARKLGRDAGDRLRTVSEKVEAAIQKLEAKAER